MDAVTPTLKEKLCDSAGCPFATDGTCLEGLAPEECPHRILTPIHETDSSESSSSTEQDSSKEYRALPSGRELLLSECSEYSASGLPLIVFAVGQVSSGKTTLLAELFGFLHRGIPNETQFRGSGTLVAFLDLWKHAVIESGLQRPVTGRTTVGEGFTFLHLNLSYKRRPISLLLANASGEVFTTIVDLGDQYGKYADMRLANYYLFLLDGEKLAQVEERYNEESELTDLIDRLTSLDYLSPEAGVGLAISKYDLLVNAGSDALDYATELCERLITRYEHLFGRCLVLRVAARPDDPTFKAPDSIEKVLHGIVSSRFDATISVSDPEPIVPTRELARLSNYKF